MIAGIDEAGRGPVIGPMVMAILACEDESILKKMGAADSKTLTPAQREQRAERMKEFPHEVIVLSPQEIDAAVLTDGDNLNKLEARTTALLIHKLAQRVPLKEVIIDSPAKVTEKYEAIVRAALEKLDPHLKVKLTCETKADANHPVVGAASIIAKVTRDEAIRALQAEHGPLGSGYPADPETQAFLARNWREGHSFFRKSWESYKRLQRPEQQSLSDFGPKTEAHADVIKEFEFLKEHGFSFDVPSNQYEVVRMKKGKTTLIRYTTGKIVVMGPEKEAVQRILDGK